MITDSQTNFLYLAGCLPAKFPNFWAGFKITLEENRIKYDFLPGTKDVWAVDYMPVQVSKDKFVQFRYEPDYLNTIAGKKTFSNVDAILKTLGIEVKKSNINIDGGNVVHSSNAVFMTDKIFKENKESDKQELLATLKDLLEVENIYLLPRQPGDYTGHSDGMVRFVDDRTILVNDYSGEVNEAFKKAFFIAINNCGLDYHILPYTPLGNEAIGCYLNYLQVGNVIFVPSFGNEAEENIALQKIQICFPSCKLVSVPCMELAAKGGILNCISWNIYK